MNKTYLWFPTCRYVVALTWNFQSLSTTNTNFSSSSTSVSAASSRQTTPVLGPRIAAGKSTPTSPASADTAAVDLPPLDIGEGADLLSGRKDADSLSQTSTEHTQQSSALQSSPEKKKTENSSSSISASARSLFNPVSSSPSPLPPSVSWRMVSSVGSFFRSASSKAVLTNPTVLDEPPLNTFRPVLAYVNANSIWRMDVPNLPGKGQCLVS